MGGIQEYLDSIDHEEDSYSFLMWRMEEVYSLLIGTMKEKIYEIEKAIEKYINKMIFLRASLFWIAMILTVSIKRNYIDLIG